MSLDILRQEMELAILRGEAVHLTPQTVLKLLDDAEDAEHAIEELEDARYQRDETEEHRIREELNSEHRMEAESWQLELGEVHARCVTGAAPRLTKQAVLRNFKDVESEISSIIRRLERYCAKL